MATTLNPYLSFRDNAREAMDFYQSVFGGELTRSTFGELDFEGGGAPDEKDKVMHSMLAAPNGLVLMAADTPNRMPFNAGDNYSISLSGEAGDEAELRGYWEKLSDGAEVTAPLEKAPWGDTFGMCRDRFGVNWMVNIAGTTPSA